MVQKGLKKVFGQKYLFLAEYAFSKIGGYSPTFTENIFP